MVFQDRPRTECGDGSNWARFCREAGERDLVKLPALQELTVLLDSLVEREIMILRGFVEMVDRQWRECSNGLNDLDEKNRIRRGERGTGYS